MRLNDYYPIYIYDDCIKQSVYLYTCFNMDFHMCGIIYSSNCQINILCGSLYL